jgi:hypothetical protein
MLYCYVHGAAMCTTWMTASSAQITRSTSAGWALEPARA